MTRCYYYSNSNFSYKVLSGYIEMIEVYFEKCFLSVLYTTIRRLLFYKAVGLQYNSLILYERKFEKRSLGKHFVL